MNVKKLSKHILYQISVQNPEFECSFVRRIYKKLRGKDALRVKEDFCGTAHFCCEWVRKVKKGLALGVDLDQPTLDWGVENNLSKLDPSAAERITLARENVLAKTDFAPDLTLAFNFSYFIFKQRSQLIEYFTNVKECLADDGVFVLDIYGGAEAQRLQEESTDHDDFEYVWDQAKYNPITGEYLCHIHFDFPDETRRSRAFTYDWRLWSLPEVIDILREVGFQEPIVYWEGTAKDGTGNGVFKPSKGGDDSVAWVSYVVAPK